MAGFEMPSSYLLRLLKQGLARWGLRDIPSKALPPTHAFCPKLLGRMVATGDDPRLDVPTLLGLPKLGLGSKQP